MLHITTYAQLALRTAPKIGPKNLSSAQFDLVHAVFGVVGEVLELAHHFDAGANPFKLDVTNLLEELGDVSWYIPLMERNYGVAGLAPLDWVAWTRDSERPYRSTFIRFLRRVIRQDVRDARQAYQRLRTVAAEVHDQLKKHIVYGKDLSVQTVHSWINRIINRLIELAHALELNIGDIWHANIAKLKARFPDGFTEQAALNRDIARETAALRGATPHAAH